MGTALTGFLGGFLEAKTKFDQLDEQRAARQQQLEVQREELKLRQQAFKGQEAHLALQTRAQEAALAKEIREQQGREEMSQVLGGDLDLTDPEARKIVLRKAWRNLPYEQAMKLQDQFQTQDQLGWLNQVPGMMQAPNVQPRPEGPPAPPGLSLDTRIPPMRDVAQSALRAPAQLALPPGLSPAFLQKTQEVAGRLGMKPDDLLRIMHFETGGTLSPSQVNQAGSGATGLIQFMPETAKSLGTTTQALAQMTPEAQLDYVEKYLTPHKGKLGSFDQAYLAVLNPAAMGKSPETVMWRQGTPEYQQNSGLDTAKKGFITVADAVNAPLRSGGQASTTVAPVPSGPGAETQAATQADLASATAQRDQLLAEQARYTALQSRITSGPVRKELDVRLDNIDKALSRTEARIQHARQYLEPSSEFGALLRKNNGNYAAALVEQQTREVERKQQEQLGAAQVAAQKASETERGKKEAEEAHKAGQTLLDIKPQESRQYIDAKTGDPLPQSSIYSDVKARMDRGEVVFLDETEVKAYRDIRRMVPLLEQMRTHIEKVYGPGGIFENLKPEQRLTAAVTGGMARLTQSNKDLAELDRLIKGNVDNLRRSLQGQVGTQTEQDAIRGQQALTKVDGIPDSKEVAYGMYNALLETTNGMLRTYTGNDQFQHARLRPLEARGASASPSPPASAPVPKGPTFGAPAPAPQTPAPAPESDTSILTPAEQDLLKRHGF